MKNLILCTILTVLLTTSAGRADLTTGLAAYYAFDGDASDSSGNANHGIVYGAQLTEDRFGRADHAYLFDGQSSCIQVPDSSSLDITGPITLATWVKADIDQYFRVGLINKRPPTEPSGGYGLLLLDRTGEGSLAEFNLVVSNTPLPSIVGNARSDTYLNDETWHHIAWTYDGDVMRLYVDGVLEGYSEYDIGYVANNVALHIGLFPYGYNDGHGNKPNILSGAMDDVRIYNRALSAEEVRELSVVPLPSAVLLGTIGLGLAGRLGKHKEQKTKRVRS